MAVTDLKRQEPESAEIVPLPGGRQVGIRRLGTRGPAYVLLHGLLDSSAGWIDVAARLNARCVAVDLPGFGVSSLPLRPRISAYVEAVAATVGRLDLGRFVLVGHSFGGAVAAGLAERLPADVTALVLLSPAGFGRLPLAEPIALPGTGDATRRMLALALRNTAAVRLGHRLMAANGHEPAAAALTRMTASRESMLAGAVAGTQAIVAAGLSAHAYHRRRIRYDGPVVAVWGDRDRLVPVAHARGVEAALPQARIELWRGMGHHPHAERPRELVDLIASAQQLDRPPSPLASASRAAGRHGTAGASSVAA